jgi:hypothetical protein
MISEMDKDQVIELGSRNNAGLLLEQYGYTMGLAKLEEDLIAALLAPGFLGEVAGAAEKVSVSLKDRTLAAEEKKGSTQEQNSLLRQAKVWRRAVANRASRSKRMGKSIPDALIRAEPVQGVAPAIVLMEKIVGLLEANKALLFGADVAGMIAEGKRLLREIKKIDADQEVKRLKSLPEAVLNFYFEKGQLFIGIKIINDAGRELHAGDGEKAGRYNMSILYRNTRKKKNAAKEKAAEEEEE